MLPTNRVKSKTKVFPAPHQKPFYHHACPEIFLGGVYCPASTLQTQTAVACYSLRALEGAPVATPLAWNELARTKPQQYTLNNIFKRLARRQDPWKNFRKYAQKLPKI